MKRSLIILLAVVMLGGPAGYVAFIRAQASSLFAAREAGQKALNALVTTHVVTQPIHDNGAACILGMGQVLPRDRAPFNLSDPSASAPLLAFLAGRSGSFAALPEDVRSAAERLQPWVTSMRECASSARFVLVDGLRPSDPASDGTPAFRAREALDSFFAWQALELQRMGEEGAAPAVRLERCGPALALVADATLLGSSGVAAAATGAQALVPRCGEALAAATPEVRKALTGDWAKLTARAATMSTVVRWERYGEGSRAWAEPAAGENALGALERLRHWPAWDRAIAGLEAAADGEPSGRTAALLAADPVSRKFDAMRLADSLGNLERVHGWLRVLSDEAQEAQPGPHVTRENGELRITLPGAPVLKWRFPGGSAP